MIDTASAGTDGERNAFIGEVEGAVRVEMEPFSNQFSSDADRLGVFEEEGELRFDQEGSEDANVTRYPDGEDNESTTFKHSSYYPYSAVWAYFREMGGVPLLSPDEERNLAKKIEEGEKRVKTLLLQSPVGLEWITRVADQMERGEIRAKDILRAPAHSNGQDQENDSALRNRFLSVVRQVFELCAENGYLREEVYDTWEEGSATMVKMARNQMAIEALFDQIRIKKDILEDLEVGLRERVDLIERDGAWISWPVAFRQRLVNILSAVQKAEKEVKQARDDFVRANLRLVINIAKRYVNWGLSLPDLIQEGNIGLMKAVDRFDYRKGSRFATYASWWSMQGITRAIREQARTIRVPINILEKEMKIVRTFHSLVNQLGRKPTPSEVADASNIPLKKANRVLHIPMGQPISLETPVGDWGTQLGDFIPDEDALSPLETTMQTNLTMEIRKVFASLTPREAKILRMRFGIDKKREYTLEEVGQEFELSRERIRQIEAKALQKLKQPKRKCKLESFYE